jgi:serine/threonine protein phosphatase PrpC
MGMLFAAKSHIGLVRQMNQDSLAFQMDMEPWKLMVIADGMGGASAGEVASKLAADTVSEVIANELTNGSVEPENLLQSAVHIANRRIWLAANDSEEYVGMGTTLVIALFDDQRINLAHVGDSRAYLYQDNQLRQVTRDHSLVAELVRRGQLTEEEALHHPQRNIVTRSLGTAEYSDPEIDVVAWRHGDILMLCTDGLSNLVTSEEIADSFSTLASASAHRDVEQVADDLIRLGLERGAPDNITLVLVVHREECNPA